MYVYLYKQDNGLFVHIHVALAMTETLSELYMHMT